MAISFENIKTTSKQKIIEIKKTHGVNSITEQDWKNIDFYVTEMERHIVEHAESGLQKFIYDCSTLELNVFHALATAFKKENGDFFVMTSDGEKRITVEWSGQSEV